MAEYIEREKVIAEIDKGDLLVGDNAKWAKEMLYRTPTADVVSVVRCEKCKWFGVDSTKGGFCMRNASPSMWRNETGELKPEDYCSYGERRCSDESRTY